MSEENDLGIDPVMPTQDPAQNPKGSGRWVKILLAASLGVNLLIGGLVFGNFLHGRADIGGPEGRIPIEARMLREMGLGPFLGAFVSEQRRQLAHDLREHVPTTQNNRAALVRELTDILQAIRAEPYDSVALEAVFASQNGRISDRVTQGRNVVLDAIMSMNNEERAAFADRMEHSMRRAMTRAGHDQPSR